MKMMGVNPLSHFFAWFLECTTYLLTTIVILTLVLRYGGVLPKSNGFLIFLYLCDYGLSILAFSYLMSSFFDKTYIAGLSASLIYVLCFFPFIIVLAVETSLSFSAKSALVRSRLRSVLHLKPYRNMSRRRFSAPSYIFCLLEEENFTILYIFLQSEVFPTVWFVCLFLFVFKYSSRKE